MPQSPVRIMFICSGNICRSPLAHRVLEHHAARRDMATAVAVESSGVGAWHVGEDADPRMRETAGRHGVRLHHEVRQLHDRDVRDYDLLFAMDRGHYRDIRRRARGRDLDGVLHMFRDFDPQAQPEADGLAPDVPDPYYGGRDGFELVYQIVDRTSNAILDAIAAGTLGRSA